MSRIANGLTALVLAALLTACAQKAATPSGEAAAEGARPNLALVERTADDRIPTVVVSAKRT